MQGPRGLPLPSWRTHASQLWVPSPQPPRQEPILASGFQEPPGLAAHRTDRQQTQVQVCPVPSESLLCRQADDRRAHRASTRGGRPRLHGRSLVPSAQQAPRTCFQTLQVSLPWALLPGWGSPCVPAVPAWGRSGHPPSARAAARAPRTRASAGPRTGMSSAARSPNTREQGTEKVPTARSPQGAAFALGTTKCTRESAS